MTVATAVTASRLVFFALFVGWLHEGKLVLAVSMFVVSWSLDVMDGVLARWLKQETAFGWIFDKAVDRMVLAIGLLIFMAEGVLTPSAIFLATKDLLLLPVVIWLGVLGRPIQDLGLPGKVYSFFQGAGILWLLLVGSFNTAILWIVALFGCLVVGRYIYRERAVIIR